MDRDRIESLKSQYTDQYVMVGSDRPELARFRGITGQVKTVNMNGKALVQFVGTSDRGWYDIAVEDLRIVDPPHGS